MTASEKLEMIASAIAAGKVVYIGTALRITKITPKLAARWSATGNPVVKISADGKSLRMAQGRGYVCADYCSIAIQ